MAVSKIVQLPTANRGWETHEPPAAPLARRHHATELVVRGVSKSFNIDRKPLPVLQDINLVAQPGQFITVYRAVTLRPDDNLLRLTFRARHDGIKVGKQNYFDGRIMMNFKDAGGSVLKPGPKTPTFKGTANDWKEQSMDPRLSPLARSKR